MKTLKKMDNYSLAKKILSEIPSGLDSKLKIIDQKVIPFVNELSLRLGINLTETVIFSAIIHSQMTQKKCETSRLAEFLNTPLEYFYNNQDTVNTLIFKNVLDISFEYQANESYQIKRSVRNTFFSNSTNACIQKSNYSFLEILDFVHEIFSPFKMNSDDVDELRFYREKLTYILKNNKNLTEVKMLNKTKLAFSEQIILMIVVLNNSIKKGSVNVLSIFDTAANNLEESFRLFTSFNSKTNSLIKENYIELSTEENADPYDYVIGAEGLKFINNPIKLNDKVNILPKSELLTQHLPEKTTSTPLYFDDAANGDYNRVAKLLDEDNFIKFAGKNCITKGLNILFYGTPGTGKTESVMQLAKSSGRIVLQANVSTIRDKWIGSSEKNAQKIFDDYELIAKECKVKPILLLNEADAILGSRQAVSQYADQSNNTMQNIFLECLENFTGILIATTNLQNNLDKAFDRRFLIKMNFQLPSKQIRLEICTTKIKDVPFEIHQIISEFEFSGGQLDNICKKIKMYELIDGIKMDAHIIKSICLDEQVIKKSSSNKIGF